MRSWISDIYICIYISMYVCMYIYTYVYKSGNLRGRGYQASGRPSSTFLFHEFCPMAVLSMYMYTYVYYYDMNTRRDTHPNEPSNRFSTQTYFLDNFIKKNLKKP
jgi:hypothetical protein